MSKKLEFMEVDEPTRTYHYADGSTLEIPSGVKSMAVTSSGTHRINANDGRRWIVVPGWIAVEFTADDWTF